MSRPYQKVAQQNPSLDTFSEKAQQALAHLRLEGIDLTKEDLADLKLFDEGKLSAGELVERAITRAKS